MLYDKIREIYREKGVSVASVEKKAGLSNGAISKWKMPKVSAIVHLRHLQPV